MRRETGRRNPRPSAWEADALPLSYSRIRRTKLLRFFYLFNSSGGKISGYSTIFRSDARFLSFRNSLPSGV
mgnify:CR=1 FL=1